MPELTLQHIDRITRDVRKQEIIFSHLADELIDHLCCDIESEMDSGLTFIEAYRKVKQKMGSRRLKEIQEETLYAVDTKYRKMKNTMKISGIAGTVILGFAALFKIQHWPAAGIMLTLGALILAFVFMPSALGVLWKETRSGNKLVLFLSAFFAGGFFILGTLFKVQHWPAAGLILTLAAFFAIFFFIPSLLLNRFRYEENKQKRPVYVIGALGLIFLSAGLFFKMMHWPLASILMASGLPLIFFIALPWYTWITWKDEEHISSAYLYIAIGSLAVMVPATLLNLNLQYSYEEGFYQHQEQQEVLNKHLFKNNSQMVLNYTDSLNNQLIKELHSATNNLTKLVDAIQIKMIKEAENSAGAPAAATDRILRGDTGTDIQYRLLSMPYDPGPVISFLKPGSPDRMELNKAVLDYRNLISGIVTGLPGVDKFNIPDPAGILPFDFSEYTSPSLMSGLHTLEVLKTSLLSVEANIINTLMAKR